MHEFEEPQLLSGKRQSSRTHEGFGAIEHQGFLRMQRDQRSLRGGKLCRVKHTVSDLFDVTVLPIIATVIFR